MDLRLQSHFRFAHHFCRVRRPDEKGDVEATVGFARRTVPAAASWESLNAELTARCQADLVRRVRGEAQTKADRLVRDRAALRPLPAERFEARRVELATANTLSLVRFDRNDYSVPTAFAHHPVTAVGGIDVVRVLCRDELVATHRRHRGREQTVFDPVHSLALLERKPGAFDRARPLAEWPLPEPFAVLRRRFEGAWGRPGLRHFTRVLRLLEHAAVAELATAVEQALALGVTTADGVRVPLEQTRETPVPLFGLDGRPHLARVRVPAPDLKAYHAVRAGGGEVPLGS